MVNKIGILGNGSISQAISHLLKKNGFNFTVYSRTAGNIEEVSACDVLFLCIPSAAIFQFVPLISQARVVISCAKGLAEKYDDSSKTFVSTLFDDSKYAVISGPNFANEIVQDKKTITTIASKNKEIQKYASTLLKSDVFLTEETDDVLAVEICGIVKNVIAILMGYASVKMPSWNEKSLILTKCVQELALILQHFNCDKSVLELSCGIGDIFLTCSSENSRNFSFGRQFAFEMNTQDSSKTCQKTIEGLRSLEFVKSLNIDLPTLTCLDL